jgi:hypothetical protein
VSDKGLRRGWLALFDLVFLLALRGWGRRDAAYALVFVLATTLAVGALVSVDALAGGGDGPIRDLLRLYGSRVQGRHTIPGLDLLLLLPPVFGFFALFYRRGQVDAFVVAEARRTRSPRRDAVVVTAATLAIFVALMVLAPPALVFPAQFCVVPVLGLLATSPASRIVD